MLASCPCSRLMRNGEAASAAPALTVVSRRRRVIDPDLVVFLVMVPPLDFMFLALLYSILLVRPRSNSSQRGQDDLRRQRNFGNHGAERPERVIHRVGYRRGGAGRPG